MRGAFAGLGLMLLLRAHAGIEPGSKELGAVWFIGDSITQSNADKDENGSPRKALYDLLTEHGYSFTYTGHHARNVDGLPSTGTNAVDNLYHYHSGISGSVIGDNIANRVGMTQNLSDFWSSGRLADVKPNLVLVMLGTNDVGRDHDLSNAPERLKKLVQAIYDLPGIGRPTVFLATIPPNRRSESETANVIGFNAAVPGIVSGFKAQGRDIHFVDQFAALDQEYATCMRPDNLHPNATGNEIMARQWFHAISAVVEGKTAHAFPGKKGSFRGFDRYDFSSGRGDMIVLCPKEPAPGNPWIWKGFFWGNKVTPAIEWTALADVKCLEQGRYVVIAGGDPLGHPSGNSRMDAIYETLVQNYGFSKKPAMVGLSREALSICRWASANPEKVGCIYLDHGVCALKSWPGGKLVTGSDSKAEGNAAQWAAMKKLYGFSSDAEALAYDQNPVDLLEPLAKARVPMLLVCGDSDITVPYEENGAILKARYEKLGGPVQLILQEGVGHHPHGLADPTPVMDFIKQHS